MDWRSPRHRIFEGETKLTGDLAQLDEKLAGTLKELIADEEFEGKTGSTAISRVGGKNLVRKIALIGLGKSEDLKLDTWRSATAAIARLAAKEKTLGISLPVGSETADKIAQAMAEAIVLALHQDNRFKSEPEDKQTKLETVDLIGLNGRDAAIARGKLSPLG